MLSRNTGWCDFRIVVIISALAIFLLAGAAWAQPHEEWNKTFGGTTLDGANSVQETSDGGYILAGMTQSFGAGNHAWLVKTDLKGNEQWNRVFGNGSDVAFSVRQTKDGGYIIAGETNSYGAGSSDAWLIKVGEESTGTEKAQAVSPTVTFTPGPTHTLTAVPTDTQEVRPTEKAVGFEAVLAITILLAVYITGRRRW